MSTLTIVGAQWGDEGKGKITDYFARYADVVIRWAGGDNAGHTIKFANKSFSLSAIPSGIFQKQTLNIIGAGCVVNLQTLVKEIAKLEKADISTKNLRISARAHIILPYHIALDKAAEASLGKNAIGTTHKGIGPAYQDKVKRSGIMIGELFFPKSFRRKLSLNVNYANEVLSKIHNAPILDFDEIYADVMQAFNIIKDKIANVAPLIAKFQKQKAKILFEGAQGVMLDLTFGTYPFVTSSHPCPGSIPIDVGMPPQHVNNVLGIVKAYTSRVGNGVFPTEITGAVAEKIRTVGHEYGTVTKRPRRIGWLDAVALRHAIAISGISHIAIMLLDVLTGIDEIKICTAYNIKGLRVEEFPPIIEEYADCELEFISMPGWNNDITNITTYEDLPIAAQNYLNTIHKVLGVPVSLVSVGPKRNQTIEIHKIGWDHHD